MSRDWTVNTDRGLIPVTADSGPFTTWIVLAHGAGSHKEHATMLWLADICHLCEIGTVRFNFLYRAMGKNMPDRMPVLIDTYRSVVESVKAHLSPERLLVGGHSMGGRVASMLEAEGKHADGLVLFGYPLHPPGQTDKLRSEHLPTIQTRTLQLSGTTDEFCNRELMDAVKPQEPIWTLHWVEGADHSYNVKKSSGRSKADVSEEMRVTIAEWLTC